MTTQLIQVPPDAKFDKHEQNFEQYKYPPAVRAGGLLEIYSSHVDLPNCFDNFIEVKSKRLTSYFPAWTALGIEVAGRPQLKMERRSVAAFRV